MTSRRIRTAVLVFATSIGLIGPVGCDGGAGEETMGGEDVYIPTEAEADAEATEAITEKNADAVFEELSREIDEEPDDIDG